LGWNKINVDASFSDEQKNGSWGAVLRDSDWKLVMLAWGVIPYCRSADVDPEYMRSYSCNEKHFLSK
jgi:hypothetical protein